MKQYRQGNETMIFDEHDLSILYQLIDKDIQEWEAKGERPEKLRSIREKMVRLIELQKEAGS